MMRKSIYSFFILLSISVFSQNDVFDIARFGTVDELKIVERKNPDVINTVNENGATPLILACYKKNNEVAKYLIDSVKNIDTSTEMGAALMACVVKGNIEIALLLLEKGSNPNLTDINGTTALMYAVQFKNVDLIRALLKHKADKTKIDNKGKTAFEYAVFSGSEEIINLLK